MTKIERLERRTMTDRFGNCYGMHNITEPEMVDKINEIIDRLNEMEERA